VSADTKKQVPAIVPVSSGNAAEVSNGEFLTIQQIAVRWNLSQDKVRRVFAQEPGVLVLVNETSRGNTRRYSTTRIPPDVLLRVERKYSLKG
jgi:hypothetical protein